MTLDINIGDGADALTINQLTDALSGTYWVEGWEAAVGDGDFEVDIEPGSGVVGGDAVETESTQTVDFGDDVDADDPRKAVISVDGTGTVQKTLGDPTAADPEGEIRERTFDPAPPDNAPGVAVAEVWIDAGSSELVEGDVRSRRVTNEAAENAISDYTQLENTPTTTEGIDSSSKDELVDLTDQSDTFPDTTTQTVRDIDTENKGFFNGFEGTIEIHDLDMDVTMTDLVFSIDGSNQGRLSDEGFEPILIGSGGESEFVSLNFDPIEINGFWVELTPEESGLEDWSASVTDASAHQLGVVPHLHGIGD